MAKKNSPFLFLIYFLIASVVILGSQCKKDPPPDDPDDGDDVITCTSNIQDGCLDDWKVYQTNTGNYINPTAGFLQTLNELASLPAAAGGPGPVTVDTVTDCIQGKYAARLVSASFNPMGTPIFIPGYIGASVLDIPYATIHLGKPYTQRPLKFQGYYKYAPAGGDSALIQVMLTRFAAGKRDTIAFDKVIVKNPVPNYILIDLPLTYRDSVNNPDTLVLIFAASAKIRFDDFMSCDGQVGSTMWVDDLKFVFP